MLKTVSSIANSIGALNYKGTWDAATNVPPLASGVGTKGDYYVVSVAGSTTLDGISTWYVGDWAAFNGSVWQRLEGGVDDPAPSLKSNSSTGLMQITGPAAASTRVMTVPDANFTAARTDAAQTFTGDQSFSGNIKSTGNTDGYSGPVAITSIASGASGTVSQSGGGVTLVSGGISFNNFWDLVIWQFAGNAVTISSAVYGSPSSRTYSVSSGNLVLAITNNNNTGTYSIGVTNIGN